MTHPVEPVVILVHDVQDVTKSSARGNGRSRPRPCGQVAHAVTPDYLRQINAGEAELVCNGCHRRLTLDDVSGDEPSIPPHLPPHGAI